MPESILENSDGFGCLDIFSGRRTLLMFPASSVSCGAVWSVVQVPSTTNCKRQCQSHSLMYGNAIADHCL